MTIVQYDHDESISQPKAKKSHICGSISSRDSEGHVVWLPYVNNNKKDFRSIYLYIYALLVVYLLTLGDLARLGQAKRKVFHEEGALSVQDI